MDHGLVQKKEYFREIDLGYCYEVFDCALVSIFFVVRWRRIEASSEVMMWCHFWMTLLYGFGLTKKVCLDQKNK